VGFDIVGIEVLGAWFVLHVVSSSGVGFAVEVWFGEVMLFGKVSNMMG
jgi:hypothetical protein